MEISIYKKEISPRKGQADPGKEVPTTRNILLLSQFENPGQDKELQTQFS